MDILKEKGKFYCVELSIYLQSNCIGRMYIYVSIVYRDKVKLIMFTEVLELLVQTVKGIEISI